MGQQQLLLIVVGVVIVGIAVAVGIQMFGEQSAQANLDSVIGDLQGISAKAHQYYLKPTSIGGGGRSFAGLTADAAGLAKLTTRGTNDNGAYTISTAGDAAEVVVQGAGVEDGDGDGNTVQVKYYVRADVNDDSLAIVYR
ncbi:MAG: hypothetical protein K8R91_05440 [Phycisphaerae bacterium]|nr:hypothetical protein [Phycisphaerae bacterium]